jgi:hypothetical protein
MPFTVQVLMTPRCGHGQQAVGLVSEILGRLAPQVRLEAVVVVDQADAERLKFPGSPTVRVNGTDIDPGSVGGIGVG